LLLLLSDCPLWLLLVLLFSLAAWVCFANLRFFFTLLLHDRCFVTTLDFISSSDYFLNRTFAIERRTPCAIHSSKIPNVCRNVRVSLLHFLRHILLVLGTYFLIYSAVLY